jgi:hypothetical protein
VTVSSLSLAAFDTLLLFAPDEVSHALTQSPGNNAIGSCTIQSDAFRA